MKIIFSGKYKSLTSFESEDLPDFTVVTGKNGSGKSQLIHCIDEGYAKNQGNVKIDYKILFEPRLKTQVSDLLYKSAGPATNLMFNNKIDVYFQAFNALRSHSKELYNALLSKGITLKDFISLDHSEVVSILEIADYKEFWNGIMQEKSFVQPYNQSIISRNHQQLQNKLKIDIELFNVLSEIRRFKGKEIDHIRRDDFLTTPLHERYIDVSDMFTSKVELIFYNYLKRRADNDYLFFRNKEYNESHNVLSAKDFEEKYPSPWDLINNILAQNSIPIRVKTYNVPDFSANMVVNAWFTKVGKDDVINFEELSTGEQVIIGIIIKLFTEKYYLSDLKFPELVVLDEPDAYLHPEMSKLLIDVLFKSFVQKLGIKVIITTHSPSTVALAPEDSIFEMSNSPCSIKKISKDSALELLTGKIPTLSIDYKNHKQIFLESPTDVDYFQKLFNKLNSEEALNYKLYFISNEMGKSNSDWVKAIVTKLREGGVKRSFGIIDWDGKNKSSVEVLVHGENKRYSVENFLCDAVYFSILFLESNGANNIRPELNFDETYNQYNLSNEIDDRLQEIWNWFTKKIEDRFLSLKSKKYEEIYYYNGRKVSIPQWFLKIQGHELETKIKAVFPSLSKFTSEGDLQNKLSIIMAKCFPLVPLESVELLKKLCI